jgi:hypothetical protein
MSSEKFKVQQQRSEHDYHKEIHEFEPSGEPDDSNKNQNRDVFNEFND